LALFDIRNPAACQQAAFVFFYSAWVRIPCRAL